MLIHLAGGIIVQVRKSKKAKRILLKIKKTYPELVVPLKISIKIAEEFLKQDRTISWLQNNLAKQQILKFEHNNYIKILGVEYKIIHSDIKSRGIEIKDAEVIIYGDSQTSMRRIKRFFTIMLKEKVTQLVNNACDRLGLKYNKITIKETSTRLGSCSSKGNLSFCLRLIFTEYFILEYVVVHEVCHLKEMNHSKNFWLLVESVYSNWRQAKKWLKENQLNCIQI